MKLFGADRGISIVRIALIPFQSKWAGTKAIER